MTWNDMEWHEMKGWSEMKLREKPNIVNENNNKVKRSDITWKGT